MPVNMAEVQQILASRPAQAGDFQFYKFPMLKMEYGTRAQPHRILVKLLSWPPEGGVLAKPVKTHFGLAATGKASVICPKQHQEDALCPICEHAKSILQSGNEVQRKAISELVQKERFWFLLLNVTELQTPGAQRKVYVWNAPPMNFYQILAAMQEPWGDFTALQNSYMVQLAGYRDGSSKAGKVDATGVPQQISIDLDEWRPFIPDLTKVLESPPPNMIEAMMFKSPKAPQGASRIYGPGGVRAPAPVAPVAPVAPIVVAGVSVATAAPTAPVVAPAAATSLGFTLGAPAAAPAPTVTVPGITLAPAAVLAAPVAAVTLPGITLAPAAAPAASVAPPAAAPVTLAAPSKTLADVLKKRSA